MSMSTKEKKQYQLSDKEHCLVYLRKIITVAEKIRYNLERYLKSGRETMNEFKKNNVLFLPHDQYSDMLNMFGHVEAYVLNIFGDAQDSSVSYFKFRRLVERLQRKGSLDVALSPHAHEETRLLNHFNRTRNFQNHIPESIIVSEQDMIAEGKALPEKEYPIEVYTDEYVSSEMYEDMINSFAKLYECLETLIGMAMRDYEAILGRSVELKRIHCDEVRGLPYLEVVRRAAKVQGIVPRE